MGAKHLLLLSLLALVFFLSFLIAVTYTQLHCQSTEYQRSCMELSGFHISEPTDGCSRVSGTRRRVLHPKKTEPTLDVFGTNTVFLLFPSSLSSLPPTSYPLEEFYHISHPRSPVPRSISIVADEIYISRKQKESHSCPTHLKVTADVLRNGIPRYAYLTST